MKFAIDLSGAEPQVSIDGVPLPARVTTLRVEQRAGEIPHLALAIDARDISLLGEGSVAAGVDSEGWARFLDRVDVKRLEAEAMERTGWDMTPTQAMIAILKEWANGAG